MVERWPWRCNCGAEGDSISSSLTHVMVCPLGRDCFITKQAGPEPEDAEAPKGTGS